MYLFGASVRPVSEPQRCWSSGSDGCRACEPSVRVKDCGAATPLLALRLGPVSLAQMVDGVCAHPDHMQPHTHTHTPAKSHIPRVPSRFSAPLPPMLRPHFVLTSTSPPSAVSCPAPVGTAGRFSASVPVRMK